MATYYVDTANGNDGNSGLTEALAFATIQQAENSVAAGDTIYVEDTGNYNEKVTVSTQGTDKLQIYLIGYSSTPGDGGRITIDAQSTRDHCVDFSGGGNNWWFVENVRFTGGTDHNVEHAVGGGDNVQYRDCRFDNSAADGLRGDYGISCLNCEIDNNAGTYGFDTDQFSVYFNCWIHNNGVHGCRNGNGVFIHCRFSENDNHAVTGLRSNGNVFYACDFIGDGTKNNSGIIFHGQAGVILNCLFDGFQYGIATGYDEGIMLEDYNNFYDNTTDRQSIAAGPNSFDSDPEYVAEGSDNFQVVASSPHAFTGIPVTMDGSSDVSQWTHVGSTIPVLNKRRRHVMRF